MKYTANNSEIKRPEAMAAEAATRKDEIIINGLKTKIKKKSH